MKRAEIREARIFRIAVIASLAGIYGLVAGFVARENSTRRIGLEFSLFRVMTAMTEGFREGDTLAFDAVKPLGFGLYAPDGSALMIMGSAPSSIDADDPGLPSGIVRYRGANAIIIRRMGMAALSSMRGMRGMRGVPGMQNAPAAPDGPNAPGMPGMPGMFGRGNGSFVYFEVNVAPYHRERAFVIGAAVLVSVALGFGAWLLVSTWERYERLRASEERNRELVSLGEAARLLAHEIKNPLGVIRVHCGLLKRDERAAPPDSVRVIEEETLRIGSLVDKVRDFIRADEGDPVDIDLAKFASSLGGRWGDRVTVGEAPSRSVRMDENRLLAAMDNLVRNALEANDEAGATDPVEISFKSVKGRVELTVSDRGPGVPEDARPDLWKPFHTTKTTGTGLGLAQSRKNVARAGGNLDYAPRAGGGSVFTITLPAREDGER